MNQLNNQPQNNQSKTAKRQSYLSMAFMMFFLMLAPDMALAADDPVTGFFQNILDILNGGLTRIIATIAVIVLGIMALRGKLEWSRAGAVIGGIFIIFSATAIIDMVQG